MFGKKKVTEQKVTQDAVAPSESGSAASCSECSRPPGWEHAENCSRNNRPPYPPGLKQITFSYEQVDILERMHARYGAACAENTKQARLYLDGRLVLENLVSRLYESVPVQPYTRPDAEVREQMIGMLMIEADTFVKGWQEAKAKGWNGHNPWTERDAEMEAMVRWLSSVITSLKAAKGPVIVEVTPPVLKFLYGWGLLENIVYAQEQAETK